MTRNECIWDLEIQIGWIKDIPAHHFPGWVNVVNAMDRTVAFLKSIRDDETAWR